MTGTHSPEFVGLSLLVAIAASYVAFALAAHISTTRGWASAYWLAGGAVALGSGIWAMHFIGMLAFRLPIPMSYDITATAASLLIAIMASACALYVAARRRPSLPALVFGAITMGAGIVLMHYVGTAAMQISPAVTFDPTPAALAVAIAVAASALALLLAFRMRSKVPSQAVGRRLLAALAMGVGIWAMHYMGTAAARFAPNSMSTVPGATVDQFTLAIIVAALTFAFLGATMLILTIDVRLANQLDEANARVAALAREDPLTHLANRRTFLEHLDAAFSARDRGHADFAVLFLDLDGFKDVNDTLGHAAGDALIVEVAERLKRTARRDDLVARFGGDEFAILQRNVNSPSDAGALAEKVSAAVADHFFIDHDEIAVTASIGIAQVSDATASPTDLMMQADLALYRAKDEGRNRYRFHDMILDRQVHVRALLARELQSAIARGELELHYKPQLHIASGRIVGLETRVQWNHPSRGVIKPQVLIPLAERAGMIRAVGSWAIEEACRQLRRWQDSGIAPPALGVDLFGGLFKVAADIGSDLRAHLDTHGIEPHRIELEFEEVVFTQAVQRHASALEDLRAQGFRMALVDFGEGYSSISYLAKAPVQRLKIAPALVAGALHSASCASAIRAIVNVAREIGAETIGDGVETEAQALFLLAAGCEQAQGQLFGKPLSAMEATTFLREASLFAQREPQRKSSAA